MFWVLVVLMTAAAVLAALWPLARRPQDARSGSDVEVYRDQLDELGRDRALGRIGAAEAEAARIEVSRRLIAAVDAAGSAPDRPAAAPAPRRRAFAVALLAGLPIGAFGLYLALGSPQLPGQPITERQATRPDDQGIEALVARTEAYLQRNPSDGRGWEVLAPVYLRLGRFDDAVKARQNALRLNGESAERQTDLGEALMASANGIVTADANKAFERAITLDANDPRARFYLGLAAEQDGRKEEAATRWRELLASAPADAPWKTVVSDALARVEGRAPEAAAPVPVPPPRAAPGPSAADVAAAADLGDEARSQMIRGMVERLAQRLQQDGSDVDGWMRLMRAYIVLGERDRARAAADDARRAMANDAGKLRQINDAVAQLGLGS